MTREQLKERVRKLPMQPGVYTVSYTHLILRAGADNAHRRGRAGGYALARTG